MKVPADCIIALKSEKISKYKELEAEILRMWYMRTTLITFVVGLSLILKSF